MAEHRTSRLKIYGDGVEVEKLINSRYRVIVRCMPQNKLEDWYYTNIGNTFAEFATEMDDEIKVDGVAKGWQGVTAMPYSNAKLIAMEMGYTQTGDYVVTFIYETLTASWVSSEADVVGATENGLRTLTKTQVAAPGTTVPYDEDDVGVETITNGGKTLYLAGLDDVSDERMSRFITRWAEPGILDVDVGLLNEGVKRTTYTYLGTEGSPAGKIISRRTGNYQGFQTIIISVITNLNGESLTGEGGVAKLNFQYQQLVPFTFPGVVDLVREQNHIFPSVRSPVEAKVKADVLIYYQSSPNIVDADFELDSALGIWNPSEWCQKITTIDSFISDRGAVQPAYFNAQGVRGCRTRSSVTVFGDNTVELNTYAGINTPETLQLEETTETENGKSVYRQIFNYEYDVTRTLFTGGGATILRGPYNAKGTYTVELKWTGTQWQITYSDVVKDPTRTESNAGDLNYTYSIRAGGWLTTYTNVSSTNSGTLFTATSGGANPEDATWSGITVEGASNEETFTALSVSENESYSIQAAGFWIEGRNVDNGASGKIAIRGGPPNPLGKRYVLDVSTKKAFQDIDGNTTWMKQVVVADITPVS